MIKVFWIVSVGLIVLVLGVSMHFATFDKEEVIYSIDSIVKLTYLAPPSYAVAYYEPDSTNLGLVEQNIVYPEMRTINRMDFVYEE